MVSHGPFCCVFLVKWLSAASLHPFSLDSYWRTFLSVRVRQKSGSTALQTWGNAIQLTSARFQFITFCKLPRTFFNSEWTPSSGWPCFTERAVGGLWIAMTLQDIFIMWNYIWNSPNGTHKKLKAGSPCGQISVYVMQFSNTDEQIASE